MNTVSHNIISHFRGKARYEARYENVWTTPWMQVYDGLLDPICRCGEEDVRRKVRNEMLELLPSCKI